jgi:hypothetical protein
MGLISSQTGASNLGPGAPDSPSGFPQWSSGVVENGHKSKTMPNSPGLSAVSTSPPLSDAIEAAALAAALAENALESERKERTVGSFEHTPQHSAARRKQFGSWSPRLLPHSPPGAAFLQPVL